MENILLQLKNELDVIIGQVDTNINSEEPLNYARGNANTPGISKNELIVEARDVINFIDCNEFPSSEEINNILKRNLKGLEYLRTNTIPNIWYYPNDSIPAYLITMRSIITSLTPFALKNDELELAQALKKQRRRIRGVEATLNDLEPRAIPLKEMVSRIEQAHETAEQLPTDLESLSEARKSVSKFAIDAEKDKDIIEKLKMEIEQIRNELGQKSKEAGNILESCEKAYAAATSVGLAAAFTERSDKLSKSMWVWVSGLILSLFAGGYFGSNQLQKLLELLAQKDISTTSMSINFIIAILSIGAPVWFSWLATKQIGQRFKLSEDYAFKASVSRAYEGFRKETARFDKDMEAKLLNSALTRLDELPLRLVETESHGSPWHELASSNIVKQAMSKIPSFPEKVKELANKEMTKSNVIEMPKGKKIDPNEEE